MLAPLGEGSNPLAVNFPAEFPRYNVRLLAHAELCS